MKIFKKLIICKICNKEFHKITASHLYLQHKTTVEEYKRRFPHSELVCKSTKEKMKKAAKKRHLKKPLTKKSKDKISKSLKKLYQNKPE